MSQPKLEELLDGLESAGRERVERWLVPEKPKPKNGIRSHGSIMPATLASPEVWNYQIDPATYQTIRWNTSTTATPLVVSPSQYQVMYTMPDFTIGTSPSSGTVTNVQDLPTGPQSLSIRTHGRIA